MATCPALGGFFAFAGFAAAAGAALCTAACAAALCIDSGEAISAAASPAAHNAPVTNFIGNVLFIVLAPQRP